MKTLLCGCIAVVLFLSVSTPALCEEQNTYIAGLIGAGLLQNSAIDDPALSGSFPGSDFELVYNAGYFLGVAVGHHFRYLRGEVEVGYQSNTISDLRIDGDNVEASGRNEVRLLTLMLNGYYDFKNSSNFTPYITAGLGLGNMDMDGAEGGGDPVSEYQIGVGCAINMGRMEIDAKYRYLATTKAEFGASTMDYTTHNIIVGIRYYF